MNIFVIIVIASVLIAKAIQRTVSDVKFMDAYTEKLLKRQEAKILNVLKENYFYHEKVKEALKK